MPKKTLKRHKQKPYKMKGCSKKCSRKHLRGGRVSSDTNLAFTGKELINLPKNPFLAYTGNGGGGPISPIPDVMSPNFSPNPYGGNPAPANTGPYPLPDPNPNPYSLKAAYPATDPPFNPLAKVTTNQGLGQRGGQCQLCNLLKGGKKMSGSKKMRGGTCGYTCAGLVGGRTLDPQGLVGKPWTPSITGWPGVDGVSNNRNYLDYNKYKVDPQLAIIDVGPNPPFVYGGKNRKNKKSRSKRNIKGGSLSNLLSQDFVNLGRQFQHSIGSTYNALNGYAQPVSPLPWRDQLPRTPNLNTLRGSTT